MSNPPTAQASDSGTLLPDGGEDSESSSEDDDRPDSSGENDPSGGGSSPTDVEGGTSVLFLDLDRVFLDVLGLEVDLHEVELQIDAMQGDGNLVGNLLSGIAGLLDSGPGGLLSGLVDSVVDGLLGDIDRDSIPGSELADTVSGITDDLPLDDLVSQVLTDVVSQLLEGTSDAAGSTPDAPGAAETGAEA